MRVIYYDNARRRVWILGARIHHGLAGFVVFGTGVIKRSYLLSCVGLWLMWDDRHDVPWLRDNI